MFQTPDQLLQLQKAALDSMKALSVASFDGFEKLAALNLQAAKASFAEATATAETAIAAKDPKALVEIAQSNVQPAADKATAYAKHVYEIAQQTNADIAAIFEKQLASSNKQLHAVIDAYAKNAPAGTEGVTTFVKSAVAAANTAFDQVTKASKQVADYAEANLASVSSINPTVAAFGKAKAKKAA